MSTFLYFCQPDKMRRIQHTSAPIFKDTDAQACPLPAVSRTPPPPLSPQGPAHLLLCCLMSLFHPRSIHLYAHQAIPPLGIASPSCILRANTPALSLLSFPFGSHSRPQISSPQSMSGPPTPCDVILCTNIYYQLIYALYALLASDQRCGPAVCYASLLPTHSPMSTRNGTQCLGQMGKVAGRHSCFVCCSSDVQPSPSLADHSELTTSPLIR